VDPRDEIEPDQIEMLTGAFRDQLVALLEECAHGRHGLFSEYPLLDGDQAREWPEAARLRELAAALQSILAQSGERNALCDEFLDLCTIHGEYDPGEPRLARAFLARIDKGEVGTSAETERKPW
jgi:hypothetical protein